MPRSREELVEALREAAGLESCDPDGSLDLLDVLHDAADFLEGLEEGVAEYRVIGEDAHGERYGTRWIIGLEAAKVVLASWKREGARSGRIQRRALFGAPWTDVDQEQQGQ